MPHSKILFIPNLVLISFFLNIYFPHFNSNLTWAQSTLQGSNEQTVRVYFSDLSAAHEIFVSFEAIILRTDYSNMFHVMAVTPKQLALLERAGLKFEVENQGLSLSPSDQLDNLASGIEGYPCYNTIEETFNEAQDMANDYPNLASWIDVGDSWDKMAGLGGHDIMVLVLTNSANSGDKPKFFATSAIHAREYATAPLCISFAKYLIENYGIDADATWILDHHEVHLMLYANPDGRLLAERGASWRKNTNQNYCSHSSSAWGADINRNFEYMWGYGTGSSDDECENDFRGPFAVSEPETQAVQDYMRAIFRDQRGVGPNDAAPIDTTGIHIDFHSYSEVVIWPWGYTRNKAPNWIQLQTLGRKFAYWNDYIPRQGLGAYPTEGTTKDFCYGELGVPSFVFELGTEFFQSCSYYQNYIVKDNLPAMIYAAKVARTPYIEPSGPNTYGLAVSVESNPSGLNIELTATVDDTQFSNRNGDEPTQSIAQAEYYIDTPPWVENPAPIAFSMTPSDGLFNDKVEQVVAQVDPIGLSDGQHIIFVRGRDADDNWGAFSAVFLNIPTLDPEQVATPRFLPSSEVYDGTQRIEILFSSDEKVYFTLNGDDPTMDSILYEQPIYLNATATLKARAYKDGWEPSDIAIGIYRKDQIDHKSDNPKDSEGNANSDSEDDGVGDETKTTAIDNQDEMVQKSGGGGGGCFLTTLI